MSQDGSKPNWADVAVLASCELFAVPLCHAGWDSIVAGEHIIRGVVALGFGLPIGFFGLGFHWLKGKMPVGAQAWMLAQSKRWWPVALIFAFLYLVGPAAYDRAVGLGHSDKVAWNLEQAAAGEGYFLNMLKLSDGEIRVLGFQAHGKNNKADPINELSGTFRSDVTNIPLPIYLLAQDADDTKIPVCVPRIPTVPQETFGVPGFADFDLATYDKFFADPQIDGMPVDKFMNQYVPFTISLTYDGVRFVRHYSKEEVQRQIAEFEKTLSVQSAPRVIRRTTAAKPLMPSLRPIVPVPSSPSGIAPLKSILTQPEKNRTRAD
jgi:hypothetical protein